MTVPIKAPHLGEAVVEATVVEWKKKIGDYVEENEVIAELETDKIVVGLSAPTSGVLVEIKAQAGDTIKIGGVIAIIAPTVSQPDHQSSGFAWTRRFALNAPSPAPNEDTWIIAAWHKEEGEYINEGDVVVGLKTNEASIEVIAPGRGVVIERRARVGSEVRQGDVLAILGMH